MSRLRISKPVRTIADYASVFPPPGWEDTFKFAAPELANISRMLEDDATKHGAWLPKLELVFRAFELTPLSSVRVVIFGQYPYHTEGVARGLAFAVARNAALQPSLKNVLKEVDACFPGITLEHGDVSDWAKQGVLLLNSSLTVRAGQPDSHSKFELWMPFVTKVIMAINKANPHCIYVMWGAKAKKMSDYLTGRNHQLFAAHPSPYSAANGFFGCRHFSLINQMLGDKPIDWSLKL